MSMMPEVKFPILSSIQEIYYVIVNVKFQFDAALPAPVNVVNRFEQFLWMKFFSDSLAQFWKEFILKFFFYFCIHILGALDCIRQLFSFFKSHAIIVKPKNVIIYYLKSIYVTAFYRRPIH
jgi:hypothetical protein